MYASNTLNNCKSIGEVVELVNDGCCEGMEGVEFSANEIAGQYALEAAIDFNDEDTSDEAIIAHLCFLEEAGAKFDEKSALDHAKKFKSALETDNKNG